MRRKYGDCQRPDGNCTLCSLVNCGKDCRDRPITKLEWARLAAGMSQKQLAESSSVNLRQIQRVELGEADAGNLTARNILAIADAIGVEVKDLL